MMKKVSMKKNKVRKIVNLSALADVFMIVIFWYIMFSNQNLENQEAIAQANMGALQEQIIGQEELINQLEERNTELNDELNKKNIELEEEREKAELLQGENSELLAKLEKEGQVVVLELTEGMSNVRILEVLFEGKTERLPFTDEERTELTRHLESLVREYLKDNRLSIMLLYDGDVSYNRDILAIDNAIESLQAEDYFIYNKVNISR